MPRILSNFARAGAALAVVASLASAPAQAQTVIPLIGRLNSAQEVPPTGSPAIGLGVYSIDTVAKTLTYRVNRTALVGVETAQHIHGYAPPGINAGVLQALPFGLAKCGVWNYPAANEPQILAGLTYANLHSTVFPGGEIRGQISETPSYPTGCYGDGSGTACPCLNNSVPAEQEGCLNSQLRGARVRAYGVAQLSADSLVLHYSRGLNGPLLLFRGTGLLAGGLGAVFGDGLRCLRGNQQRHSIKFACNGQAMWPEPGTPDLPLGNSMPATGGLVHYQCWYRDGVPTYCSASTFNLSNAVSVVWTP